MSIVSQKWFISFCVSVLAVKVAQLFFGEVYCLHGLPLSIVLDRDKRFLSLFWSSLWTMLGVSLDMSTYYHPQSDGEVVNRSLGNVLRSLIPENIKSRESCFRQAEFSQSCNEHEFGFSPFKVIYGVVSWFPVDLAPLCDLNHFHGGASDFVTSLQ